MSVKDQLIEMGFDETTAVAAASNGTRSIEEAISWIESRESGDSNESSATAPAEPAADPVAESNPVPVADRLEALREKARLRKEKEEKLNKEEQKKNDILRKKNNEEHIKAKEALKQKQAQQEAAKRRKEKIEEAKAKQRVREQIEADRRNRKMTADAEKRERAGPEAPAVSKPAAARPAPTTSKLRFVVNGKQIVAEFELSDTLGTVAESVKIAAELSAPEESLKFMTTFPTKTYTVDDFDSTLQALGLVNASVKVLY